jgi:hypothetical protein
MSLNFGRNNMPQTFLKNLCGVTCRSLHIQSQDPRQKRNRLKARCARRVGRSDPTKIRPVIHPMNGLGHRMNQKGAGSYREAGTFSDWRARRPACAPRANRAAIPIRSLDPPAKTRPVAGPARVPVDARGDRRRARRVRRSHPDDVLNGHASDERVEPSDKSKGAFFLYVTV